MEEEGEVPAAFPTLCWGSEGSPGWGPGTRGCGHSKPGRGTRTLRVPAQKCSHCSPSQLMLLGRAVLAVTQGAHGGAGVSSRVPSTPKPLSCSVCYFWCCCSSRSVGGWVVFAHLSSLSSPPWLLPAPGNLDRHCLRGCCSRDDLWRSRL